jgi:hypothetical protein
MKITQIFHTSRNTMITHKFIICINTNTHSQPPHQVKTNHEDSAKAKIYKNIAKIYVKLMPSEINSWVRWQFVDLEIAKENEPSFILKVDTFFLHLHLPFFYWFSRVVTEDELMDRQIFFSFIHLSFFCVIWRDDIEAKLTHSLNVLLIIAACRQHNIDWLANESAGVERDQWSEEKW